MIQTASSNEPIRDSQKQTRNAKSSSWEHDRELFSESPLPPVPWGWEIIDELIDSVTGQITERKYKED